MINTQKLVKVAMAWTSIVYIACYLVVLVSPALRPRFMMYALHMNAGTVYENVFTLGTFVSGLVIWNILAVLGVWLFSWLWTKIK